MFQGSYPHPLRAKIGLRSIESGPLFNIPGDQHDTPSMIFGHLPDQLFMVFSRANRALYAECILALYREFYRAPDAIDIYKPDWMSAIRTVVESSPALAADFSDDLETGEEAPNDDDRRTSLIYGRLKKSGWLREKQKHLRVAVEMPTAAILLCETFDQIDRNLPENIAGVVATIAATILAINTDAAKNANALREARRSAESFLRRLRAIRSSLYEIDDLIMGAKDLNERLANFIDIFVGKLVIQDFKSVMTSNHPYRRRHEIMSGIADLRARPEDIEAAAKAIHAAGMTKTFDEADSGFRADLTWLHGCFAKIDALFETISEHRSILEGRLRNTIRYIDRSSPERAAKMLHAAQEALALRKEIEEAGEDPDTIDFAPIPLLERHGIWSERTLAAPAQARREPEPRPVRKTKEPPEVALLRRLKRQYDRRFEPTARQIASWLEGRVDPGASCRASEFKIETLDDFLILDALRIRAVAGRNGHEATLAEMPEWSVAPAAGMREDDWATFADFEIIRRAPRRAAE